MSRKATHLFLALGQVEIFPGEISRNAQNILKIIGEYKNSNVDLLLFPELCTTGYLLGDIWERPSFLKENDSWVQKIIQSTGETAVAFGTVVTEWKQWGEDGRPRKMNTLVIAQNGRALLHPVLQTPYFPKTLSPNYREFDESRHFMDLRKICLERGLPLTRCYKPLKVPFKSGWLKISLTICEDGWGDDYGVSPFAMSAQKGADLIINASCSPFTLHKNSKRNRVFASQAKKWNIPVVYVNATGLQNIGKTLFNFDGQSTVYGSQGKILFQAPAFRSETYGFHLPLAPPFPPGMKEVTRDSLAEIYQALTYGFARYLEGCGMKKVVVGISGGIDSALTAALLGTFIEPENLLCVNMPSRHNSPTTRRLAYALARNLGCYYVEVPIEEDVSALAQKLQALKLEFPGDPHPRTLALNDLQRQNLQSRERGSRILAALAAAFGGVFTCNANKAELTVGYSTLYGDMGGFLAPLGDLWKEDVYGLARYLNQYVYKKEVLPREILELPPSAELSDTQNVDKGQGDPLHYPYHDKLFFSWVQKWNRLSPEENLEAYLKGNLETQLGCPPGLVKKLFSSPGAFIADLEKWWDLYNGLAAAKRVQAPPILALSSRAFGFDHREPVGRASYTQKYLQMKKRILK